jgi:hypothetical protein
MRSLFLTTVLGLVSGLSAQTSQPPPSLYNEKDLTGWVFVTPGKEAITDICHVKAAGVLSVDGNPNGFLATSSNYENYQLHVEWRWSGKPGNAGVLVHITEGPMDRIWPISFQVQTKNARVGDILPMASAKFAEAPTPGMNPAQLARSGADVELPVGQWNSCDIVCRGDTIEVTVNGTALNKVTKCVPSSGKIGFQLEGVPYELRNVRLSPLPATISPSYQGAPNRY